MPRTYQPTCLTVVILPIPMLYALEIPLLPKAMAAQAFDRVVPSLFPHRPGAGNPFRYQTPIRPVLAPIPGSPVWSYTTRDAVPGLDCQSSPSPGVPATPPGLNMSVDIPPASCMAVDDPVPVPCPFVVGEPGLANISNYLHNNPVGVNPPLAAAHVPPPVNQAPPPLPAAPAGFEPSTTALNWGQRQTSVLSSSSSAPIDKYFFVAISFLKYCHKHPTPNQII
ncbi:hypothetical protein H4Q26_013736 [Puccinia striiformis f. sp. tritici PST-130]|nr:hypothetical protein H4Q26_013736 [Puccinia striiformis f. sp. tritici PST-130]